MALGERLGGAHVDIDANADPFYREMDKMDRKADAAAREARRKIDRQLKNLKFDAAFVEVRPALDHTKAQKGLSQIGIDQAVENFVHQLKDGSAAMRFRELDGSDKYSQIAGRP